MSVATKRSDRSLLKMNFPIKRHYFSDHYFETGIRRRDTEFGCYNIYDVERSICDMVRLEEKIEMKILNGVKNNAQQYARVMKYAELLKVKGRILN